MVIYADVLIVLNVLVDYFLLKLTAKIICKSPSLLRLITGSILGGICSLYIFLPSQNVLTEALMRMLISFVITLSVFGFHNLKTFLQSTAVFFIVTFAYAGGMLGVWYIFEPHGMAVNNAVVYFNISPVLMICLSVAFYIIVSILRYLLSKNSSQAKKCKIRVLLGDNTAETDAIVDTGNSLSDAFGMSQVIIVDKAFAQKLINNVEDTVSRYRVLPCNTVSGKTMLEGYRCDKAFLNYEGNETMISRPIIAISKTPLDNECQAIINPRSV